MSAQEDNGQTALKILDEYYKSFGERNPNLYVFSAHIHMDEATPHIHIDFVPFITGSKRGLETRVSLKQALAAQGFKGGSRGDTEWNQWVQSEKENLALVMERHGIEWEQRGSHEKHLSVLDYKKQEREKEIDSLGDKLMQTVAVYNNYNDRVKDYDKAIGKLDEMKNILETPEYQLPEPSALMSAKNYKAKVVDPLVDKLKSLVQTSMSKCFQAVDQCRLISVSDSFLREENEKLIKENKILSEEIKDYNLLRKVFGREQIDSILEETKAAWQSKHYEQRFRNSQKER